MAKNDADARVALGNKMFAALETETDRGRACVGDAVLDEVLEDLFRKRLIDHPADVEEILSGSQPLGNHGVRLKLAFLLGWIGPETYADCRTIHKIRNRMAHELTVDSFDHAKVRDLLDGLEAPKNVMITVSGKTKRVNLKSRKDRFLYALGMAVLRCWSFIDNSEHAKQGTDPPIVRLPKPLVQS